uniref:DDE-1 domain-containing protein n=1 Tax=Plectus sambesii TaxID=2011161 RepID=A0A914V5D8_9BILA
MTGKKLPPLAIGHSQNPRCFKNVRHIPVEYHANKKAWMMSAMFVSWLQKLNTKMIANGNRKIALLLDNCPSHPHQVENLSNIEHCGFVSTAGEDDIVALPQDDAIADESDNIFARLIKYLTATVICPMDVDIYLSIDDDVVTSEVQSIVEIAHRNDIEIELSDSDGNEEAKPVQGGYSKSDSMSPSLYMGTYNARSIATCQHLTTFKEEIHNVKFNIIGIAETWLSSTDALISHLAT